MIARATAWVVPWPIASGLGAGPSSMAVAKKAAVKQRK